MNYRKLLYASSLLLLAALIFIPLHRSHAKARGFTFQNNPDAPIDIVDANCGVDGDSNYCTSKVQFNASGIWIAYCLVWNVQYENGADATFFSTTDLGPGKTFEPNAQHEKTVRHYVIKNGVNTHLKIANAQVQVQFAVKQNGFVWGEVERILPDGRIAKLKAYQDMLQHR